MTYNTKGVMLTILDAMKQGAALICCPFSLLETTIKPPGTEIEQKEKQGKNKGKTTE